MNAIPGVALIAADMDHTLLTEAGELPEGFESLVEELGEAGIEFAAASGRPRYTLEALFPNVKDRMSFICDNGAVVTRRGRVLAERLMPKADCQTLARFVRAETGGAPILCGMDRAYIEERDLQYEGFFKRFYTRIEAVKSVEETARNVEAVKFTVYFPKCDSGRYYEELFRPRYGGVFSIAVSDTMWIDIQEADVDKGYGMRVLGAELGITKDAMMAFGDSYNDIPLLEAVKYSYAVANAAEDIKRRAAFIAPSNNEAGAAQVIKQLLRRNND